MSEYDVEKPFNTVNRRFKPDDQRSNIVRGDDDLQPHSIETLEKGGFIKARAEKAETKAAAVAPPLNKLETAATAAAPATSEK